MSILLKTIVSQPFAENTYLLYREERDDCVVIDPGLDPLKILRVLKEEKRTPVALLCTHGHADHVGGIGVLKEKFPDAQIHIGEKDADKLTDPEKNLSTDFGVPLMVPAADVLLEGHRTLWLAGLEIEAFPTPGHSAGHCVFLIREPNPAIAFVGDLIFRSGVGRTDFFDGDPLALDESIRNVVYTLPDDTILYSGHGPSTTVSEEKRSNPFVR